MNEIMRMADFTERTPVLIPTVEQPIEMSVADVLRWVAPTAPPSEALKFLMACRMAQVNPFLGEAHLVDHGGRFTTIIDKSGYLKRAQSHPAYEGHEAGIIAQPFDPASKARGPLVDLPGSFLPPGYVVAGGWARVYRKGVRRPIEARVSIQEYNRNTATWKTLTCTMIRKVALVQALRESGLISSGWYASGEAPGGFEDSGSPAGYEDGDAYASPGAVAAEYDLAPDSALTAGVAARLIGLMDAAGMTPDQRLAALRRRGVSAVAELTDVQAMEMIRALQDVVDGRSAGQLLLPDPGKADEQPARQSPEAGAAADASASASAAGDPEIIDVTDTLADPATEPTNED